jgi:hypothetical protein
MQIKNERKFNERGFGHLLIFVVLALIVFIFIAAYLRIQNHSSTTTLFGPKFPDIATYHNIDTSDIKNNDESTTQELDQAVNDFKTGNPNLTYVNQDEFDGCGLFVTESNGDFDAA